MGLSLFHGETDLRIHVVTGGQQRSIERARLSFVASLPRQGAIIRQCRRCLIAHDGLATMRELRSWAYTNQSRQHWHHTSIYRALKRLGAKRIGWGMYATCTRHDK
jgi:hypothetical protein